MERMSLAAFGRFVATVMKTLPDEFKAYLDNIVVEVEQEPCQRTLQDAGFTRQEIEDGESLYGLFVPLPLPSPWSGDAVSTADFPQRILIFKGPLERDFPERERLRIEIRKTVIHELAHHFGYSDRDLARFDDNPNPFASK
jgi:predicted Zn-dependent protease with MMP-like domain